MIKNMVNNFPKTKVVLFVTRNINKFYEARRILAKYGLAIGMLRLETIEVQSESLETIAKTRTIDAVKKCNLPVIIEDAGLFIQALNGFPGPYTSYVHKTIGNQGLLKLMQNVNIRNAYFESVIAFYGPKEKKPLCFHGRVEGRIAKEIRGNGGFGFDPIFIPLKGDGKTFAEIEIEKKNTLSHRAQALSNFAKWYKSSIQQKRRF